MITFNNYRYGTVPNRSTTNRMQPGIREKKAGIRKVRSEKREVRIKSRE